MSKKLPFDIDEHCSTIKTIYHNHLLSLIHEVNTAIQKNHKICVIKRNENRYNMVKIVSKEDFCLQRAIENFVSLMNQRGYICTVQDRVIDPSISLIETPLSKYKSNCFYTFQEIVVYLRKYD